MDNLSKDHIFVMDNLSKDFFLPKDDIFILDNQFVPVDGTCVWPAKSGDNMSPATERPSHSQRHCMLKGQGRRLGIAALHASF